jgi:hypothetical protein
MAFHAFRSFVLIGVGTLLRLYEIGKKKLLKKAENRYILFIKKFYDRNNEYSKS